MPKHHVAIELVGNAGRLLRELNKAGGGFRKFGGLVKGELRSLGKTANTLQGHLAGIGISFGAVQVTRQSGLLDKQLTQIGQTAGRTREQMAGLRTEIFGMGKKSGQDIEQLKDGFNSLIQSGQSYKAAMESTRGINIAGAVTGANSDILAGALTVAATAFDIDLETPGKALDMLDKMVAAGRLGNAELESLSAIFSRVGVNAASAGMGFEKTLAFIETLSLVEKSPERLATLADSTLRLFTNFRYMAKAQKATKVSFFDDQGGRRDPVAVLKDIRTEYAKLDSDLKRGAFIQKAFGEMDLDTIKGLRTLLSGAFLETTSKFENDLYKATGTLNKDFEAATDNLIDQSNRLKNTLREAADTFTKPMRDTLAEWIKFGLDKKKLTGGQIIAAGAGVTASALALARYGPKAISAIAGKLGADGIGITAGMAVEKLTGVQPVFITNWPANLNGTPSAPESVAKKVGNFGWLGFLGRLGAAGAMTYGINEGMKPLDMDLGAMKRSYDDLDMAIGKILEVFSGQRDWRTGEMKSNIDIGINIDEARRVTTETNDMNTTVNTTIKRGRLNQ